MKTKFIYIGKTVLAVAVVFIAFVAGVFIGAFSGDKISNIKDIIDALFVLDYDEKLVEDTAAKAMVYALGDPYSEYLTVEESIEFKEIIEGSYKGIGVTVSFDPEDKKAHVEEVEDGTPAHRAGIMTGDIILGIDGIEMSEENYERIILYIKGISEESLPDEEEMFIELQRGEETLKVGVKREILEIDSVSSEIIDEVAYVKLETFTDTSAEEFRKTMEELKDSPGMVLDLRDNGGGNLDALIEIAEELLPEGILLTTEDSTGRKTEFSIVDNEYYKGDLVLLVNGDTASASEVLTAAIKETERGKVFGVTTYGKGLVQSIIPLGDGSMLKLTTEKYYTAKGNFINEKGITPDEIIEDTDAQLDRAIEYIKLQDSIE